MSSESDMEECLECEDEASSSDEAVDESSSHGVDFEMSDSEESEAVDNNAFHFCCGVIRSPLPSPPPPPVIDYAACPLHVAVDDGRLEDAIAIVNSGSGQCVDINKRVLFRSDTCSQGYHTPLTVAVERGHIELIRALLGHGAEVATSDDDCRPTDTSCGSALYVAIAREHADVDATILKLLLGQLTATQARYHVDSLLVKGVTSAKSSLLENVIVKLVSKFNLTVHNSIEVTRILAWIKAAAEKDLECTVRQLLAANQPAIGQALKEFGRSDLYKVFEKCLYACAEPGPSAVCHRVFAMLIEAGVDVMEWLYNADAFVPEIILRMAEALPWMPFGNPPSQFIFTKSFSHTYGHISGGKEGQAKYMDNHMLRMRTWLEVGLNVTCFDLSFDMKGFPSAFNRYENPLYTMLRLCLVDRDPVVISCLAKIATWLSVAGAGLDVCHNKSHAALSQDISLHLPALAEAVSPAKSLQKLAACAVRQSLCPPLITNAGILPLPQGVKNFVAHGVFDVDEALYHTIGESAIANNSLPLEKYRGGVYWLQEVHPALWPKHKGWEKQFPGFSANSTIYDRPNPF